MIKHFLEHSSHFTFSCYCLNLTFQLHTSVAIKVNSMVFKDILVLLFKYYYCCLQYLLPSNVHLKTSEML